MPDEKLTDEEQKMLLLLARKTISEYLSRDKNPKHPAYQELERMGDKLMRKRGVFVSLHKNGMLRGCIGTFSSRRAMVDNIKEMAVSAAFHDPRFPPVRGEELTSIEIEISVLTTLRKIEDIESIEVGRHGIFITCRGASGVLLPQVAAEHGWDRETFLGHTCQKAGLVWDAWRQPDTGIEIFEAEIFGDKS